MVTRVLRDQICAAYNFRCGYCGVSEAESGGELNIDHFRPLAQGGTVSLSNLVYACSTCNRFKGDYWPAAEAGSEAMLLHPGQNDLATHVAQMPDGRLRGLTPRGWFHIQRLRLNREQLVLQRQRRDEERQLRQMLEDSLHAQADLRAYSRRLERDITALMELMARFTRS
jgi:hypothetical protein